MPTEAIPIANFQQSGVDRLGGGSPIAMNVWVDNAGVVYRRPGLSTYSGATSAEVDSDGLEAIHTTYDGTLYAVGGATTVSGVAWRNIYKITAGSANKISNVSGEEVRGGSTRRPMVAETDALLVIAAGNEVQKVVLSTSASSRLSGSPPQATHIIYNSVKLLGNDLVTDRSAVRFSAEALGTTYTGHETWNWGGFGTSGGFVAEAQPDPVQALAENNAEVLVFGADTTEIYVPDAVDAYSHLLTTNHGCIAPYSVTKVEGNFAWLNQTRQFVISNGREFQPMSDDIQGDLDKMSTVADCFGYRVVLDGKEVMVWTFPTDGRTFVYQKGAGWGQWSGWDDAKANWKPFVVNCHHLRRDTGENLVGTSTGYVGKLDTDARTDLGETIRSFVQTGYLNRGTEERKWCKDVRLTVRRGQTSSTTAPVIRISYSDEPGEWSPEMEINLGVGGDFHSVVPLGVMGDYRRRAWRFDFSDAEYLALAAVEEEYEVM